MSAILKPLISCSTTITGTSDLVNIDQVLSISKEDVTASAAQNSVASYSIVFHRSAGQNPMLTKWTFATAALRNTAHAAIVTAFVTAVP
jgi:hypothetical protein